MKYIYLILAIIGAVVPYYFLVSFLVDNGLDIPLLFDQLFATDISTFFAADVIISAIVLAILIITNRDELKKNYFLVPLIGTFTIGVSFGLPMYLFLKEQTNKENS